MRNSVARLITLTTLAAGAAWAQLTVTCTPTSGPVEVNVPYSTTCGVAAPGGLTPYIWGIGPTGTTLPAGLMLTVSSDTTMATVSGTPLAAAAGSYSYRVQVLDNTSPTRQTGFELFMGTIAPALTVTTVSLPGGILGLPYAPGTALQASGGVTPYTWSISSGALPPGLMLDASSGAISGTPTMAGVFGFMATVADSVGGTAAQSLSITIVAPLMISCVPATGPTQVGVPYSATCTAAGGAAPFGWSISSGSLPPTLMLNGNSGSSVTISGTPTTAGAYSYTVMLTDSSGQSASQPYSGTILPAALAVSCVPATGPSVVGALYTSTCTASGGTAPYGWSISQGALPAGLTLSSTSGASINISGTPTTPGSYNYTVSVTDNSAPAMNATQSFSGTIVTQLSVNCTPATGPTMVQTFYSATCTASGGAQPYNWAISPGTLPAGLMLSATTGTTVTVSGTPTTAGPYSYTVRLTDSTTPAAQSATQSYSGTIVPQLLVTTISLPAGTVGVPYPKGTMLAATGGTPPYTWSISTGALPAGLMLNAATGAITGTPSAPGTFNFTAQVTDSARDTATQPLAITVSVAPLVITTSSLASGTVGAFYSQTLAGTGGVPPYTWSVTDGALPNNVTLNASTGVISGTPTAANTFNFTIQLSDSASTTPASKAFSITIVTGLTITTPPALPNATVGVAYSQTLQAAGGTQPYTWSIISGALPDGLSLNSTTGAITGMPTTAGGFDFTAQVTDNLHNSATKAFTLTVAPALSITTASLPNGTVGVMYSQTIMASGGTLPYSWLITVGAPPAGTSLNPTSGVLSGIPSSSSTFTFTVQVTDSTSVAASKQFTVTIAGALTITTAPGLPPATAGTPYSQTLAAAGGAMPYTWAVTSGSSLPAGLTLSTAGVLSGTPATAGSATFTIKVTDSTSATASKAFTLTIAPSLGISTASPLPSGEVNVAYSETLAATGGTPPYTWSISSGSLPAGLTLSSAGLISGSPSAGTFSFSAQVTDSNSVIATKAFTLTIASPLMITTAGDLNTGSIGSPYSQTLAATAGLPPYTWALTTGALPGGLALSNVGVISGLPTGAGTFSFTAQVTDAAGGKASRMFTIVIVAGLTVSTPGTLPGATAGTGYSEQLLASGGKPPYTWSLSMGSLPPGLTLSSSGLITGNPTTDGVFVFTVVVTDSVSSHASKQFTLTVAPLLAITNSTLPPVVLGATYSQTLRATGGTPPYSWSITSGTLPTGLSLSSAGLLSGMPSIAGTFTFTVEVTDSVAVSATKPLSITVTASLSITTASPLPGGSTGVSYSQALAATGGMPPYTWKISAGALPSPLALNAATGAITGTPTTAGMASFTVKVTDSLGATASQAFTLLVGTPVRITTTFLPSGTAGTAYSQTLAASGGTPPYAWSVSAGALPVGLTLSATGVLSGNPQSTGASTFTVLVTDNNSVTAIQQYTLVISGLNITTGSALPDATAGTAYSQKLAAAGGTPAYTWTVVQGALPAGLTLNATSGVISGTPTAAGNFSITIQVTDSTHAIASQAFTLAVALPAAPSASFTGAPATASSLQQLSMGVELASAYPLPITGQVTLTFQPDAVNPADDPAIQFLPNGRMASFTIAAGSKVATPFALQTGSVAGSITLSVTLEAGGVTLPTPSGLNTIIHIPRAAPAFIDKLSATSTGTSLQVTIPAYSNTRDLTQATLTFTPVAGQTLLNPTVPVPLTSAADTWYSDKSTGCSTDPANCSTTYGSQFVLTLPFTISSAGAVASVSVTLTNTSGTSSSMSASFTPQ